MDWFDWPTWSLIFYSCPNLDFIFLKLIVARNLCQSYPSKLLAGWPRKKLPLMSASRENRQKAATARRQWRPCGLWCAACGEERSSQSCDWSWSRKCTIVDARSLHLIDIACTFPVSAPKRTGRNRFCATTLFSPLSSTVSHSSIAPVTQRWWRVTLMSSKTFRWLFKWFTTFCGTAWSKFSRWFAVLAYGFLPRAEKLFFVLSLLYFPTWRRVTMASKAYDWHALHCDCSLLHKWRVRRMWRTSWDSPSHL